MPSQIVSKDYMMNFLSTKDKEKVMHFVGRALVALFNRQIESEKVANNSRVENNRGFSKPDARNGSMTAKAYLKNGKLEDWQVNLWIEKSFRGRPRLLKYSDQLNEIAIEKKAKG